MSKNSWPKRQGNIDALILVESKEQGYPIYEVYKQDKTNGPWYEGTKFFPSQSDPFSLGVIDKHCFVMKYNFDGNGQESTEIIAVAHNDKEVNKKTYKYAVKYCEGYAKKIKGKFIDKTNHNLEKLAQKH